MRGRRIQPDENGYCNIRMEPGDYVRSAPLRKGDGSEFTDEDRAAWQNQPRWLVCSPNGHCGCLDNHEVTEHEDGTITVSPSILIRTQKFEPSQDGLYRADDPNPKFVWVELYHGYLERGIWRDC